MFREYEYAFMSREKLWERKNAFLEAQKKEPIHVNTGKIELRGHIKDGNLIYEQFNVSTGEVLQKHSFPLKRIKKEDILSLRLSKKCFFLIKKTKKTEDGRNKTIYFYAEYPKKLNLAGILHTGHLCSQCKRCHALLEESGCPKVCDHFSDAPTHELQQFKTSFLHIDEDTTEENLENIILKKEEIEKEKITTSKRMEKYSFITDGYETFGQVKANCFIVWKCKRFLKEEL